MNTQKNINDGKRKELCARGHALKPSIQIGKSGFTDEVIHEVKNQLKKKKLVKVKLLKGLLDSFSKKEAVDMLVQLTGSELIHKVGFVVLLYKR